MAATDSLGLQPVGLPDSVFINASVSTKITDYGTLRVRGGVDAGTFMPYGFVGIALARADVARSASVTLFNFSQSPLPYFQRDAHRTTRPAPSPTAMRPASAWTSASGITCSCAASTNT